MPLEERASRCQSGVGDVVRQLDGFVHDTAVGRDDDGHRHPRRESDELHGAHDGRFDGRPDDDGGIVREVRQQAAGVLEHLLEGAVGVREELADLRPPGRVEPARHGQVVDEEPVALVGRDAPGRGVRLGEVALLLEHGHLVAHRRRTDLDAGRVGDMGRADRLRGLDVLLDHRPEDGCLTLVEHVGMHLVAGWMVPVAVLARERQAIGP